MKYSKKIVLSVFFLFSTILLLSFSVSAASSAPKSSWYSKNGRYYYYDKKGNLSHGTKKIKGKYYYFNSKGRQRNGWIVSKGRYYFFKNEPGKNGYRLSSTTVNGIQLQANGIAVVTSQNKTKLDLLVKANSLAYQLAPLSVPKDQRLRACFDHIVYNIRYRNLPHKFRTSSDWPEYYADYALNRASGDCYCAGCGFAYLAVAVGCENVWAVSSGGHGWAEINGNAYDPNWARMTGNPNRYFCFRPGTPMTRNDPAYFRSGFYRVRLDN